MTLLKGILTGFILSLPFGPIGLHCMEKSLSEGEKKAYVSALGMITVDMVYGAITFLFLTSLTDKIMLYEKTCKVVIGIFFIVIGIKKVIVAPKLKKIEADDLTLFQDYMETFILSVFNISSLLVIGAIFTALDIFKNGKNISSLTELILGIGLGGGVTWAVTIFSIYHFKKVLAITTLTKISKIIGVVIFVFGILTIIFAFYK